MSGICGAYGKADIEEMTRILAHRGPDDMGFYIEGPMQMGVCRLAMLDIEGGYQPVSNETGKIWAMLDGEIFNFKELRKELLKKEHKFKSKSDTEIVVHAWDEWGPKCLDKFNGHFAVALWDGKKIHLVRDRMGEKPLYFYQRGGRLLFASEIKSLLTEISAVPRFPDEFRDFEAPAPGDTLFMNIREVPPGCRISFDGNELETTSWWEIPRYDGPYASVKEYVDELRWLLKDSVKLRLRGDVPAGVFLSGGLDSATIACLSKPEHVFAATFREAGEAYDELPEAKLVAKQTGAKLHAVRPGPDHMRNLLPKIIWHLDQPVGSMSSLAAFMASQAANKKVKAVLVGQGADELFGGHIRYLMMLAEDRMGKEEALQLYLPLARYFWRQDMFSDPIDRYYSLMNRGPGVDPKCRARIRDLFDQHTHVIDKMGYADLHIALPTVLHMDDRAAAAYGIENRNPFLDHRIVEFAFRIPPELKVDGFLTKVVLRKAMKGIVPDPILERRDKMGLAVPVGRWFKKELKRWADVRVKRFRERYETNFLDAAWDAAGDRGEFDRREYMRICMELWMEIMVKQEMESWEDLRLAKVE